jgi:uncharacterized damage-inducible protein DinB
MTATFPRPTTDERDLLLSFLAHQREKVMATCAGITNAQAHWQPDGKLIPLIGIVNHLRSVEWRWIDGCYLRKPVSRSEEEFHPPAELTIAEALDVYRARAEKTDRIVRDAPGLDAECFAPSVGDGMDLRFVLVHLIEETAHHAGHADSTREMLDGATALGID